MQRTHDTFHSIARHYLLLNCHVTTTLSQLMIQFLSSLLPVENVKMARERELRVRGGQRSQIWVKWKWGKKKEKRKGKKRQGGQLEFSKKRLFRSVSGHPAERCPNVTLLWLAALATHRQSATTPADIYSFRHGDLCAPNQHVKSRYSAFYLFIMYRDVCLLSCLHEADKYMKCSLLLPGCQWWK